MNKPKVVVIGGYGTFGSLIADQLVGNANIFIAGRNEKKGRAFASTLRAEFIHCNTRDIGILKHVVKDSMLVINASGPFQPLDYSVPEVCIENQCHYIDIADGRDYVSGIGTLREKALARKVFVCSGASTAPAVTSAMISQLLSSNQKVSSIKIALTAGNKNKPGPSTFASILSYIGKPIKTWQNSKWINESGWGMQEFINFPGNVGRRHVQLCDVPDLELFPMLFNAETVIFKAGVELPIFNDALSALALMKRYLPLLQLSSLSIPLVRLSKLFKSFGSRSGSVAVWVTNTDQKTRFVALVAHDHGPRIPTTPAVLLARKIISGNIPRPGAYPCVNLLSFDEIKNHLRKFGIFEVCREA